MAASGGNLLIVGRSGSGKTTLLKQLVARSATADRRRYRFYFDMSLKRRDEEFREFVTRVLTPYMAVESTYVFDVFHYFARSGSVLCALDGIDEAVPSTTQAGFLELFAEIAQVLSAESAVITTSRVSFLEDSPQVRRLLDGTALVSEKLVQQLHAQGVNPLLVPRFSALRLHDVTAAASPLEMRLADDLDLGRDRGLPHLAELAWQHLTQVRPPGLVLTSALPRSRRTSGRPSCAAVRSSRSSTSSTTWASSCSKAAGSPMTPSGSGRCSGSRARPRWPSSTPPTRSCWPPNIYGTGRPRGFPD